MRCSGIARCTCWLHATTAWRTSTGSIHGVGVRWCALEMHTDSDPREEQACLSWEGVPGISDSVAPILRLLDGIFAMFLIRLFLFPVSLLLSFFFA